MQQRVTRGSSGRQKRQVRMLQRRLEQEGAPRLEARSRARQKSIRLGSTGAKQGGRIISRVAENAELARRPKRKAGIKVKAGRVTLPRRITSKRAEAVTSGRAFRKRATKSRKRFTTRRARAS